MYRVPIRYTDELRNGSVLLRHGLNFSRVWWMIQLVSGKKRLEACIRAEGGHFEHCCYVVSTLRSSVVVDFAAINKVMKLRVWQASWFLWLFPNEIERSCLIKTADDEVRLFSDLFGNCVADDGNDGVWQTDVLAPWGQCRWLLNLIASGARVPSDTTYVLDGLSRSVLWRDSFFNPFKPSGVKWLHYKVFKAILV